jgi:hypothetical protein
MRSQRFIVFLALTIVALALSACGPSEEELVATSAAKTAAAATDTPIPTSTFTPTITPTITFTPTLTPTLTPTSTPTSTPVPYLNGVWHRLSAAPGITPQHQVNDCQGLELWTCLLQIQPEPDLGFDYNELTGQFEGSVIPEWHCPNWFPYGICNNAIYIVGGKTIFKEGSGPGMEVEIEYIVTEIGGEYILYEYWVNRFACPWYRTFDEALAANSFPYHRDCVAAP